MSNYDDLLREKENDDLFNDSSMEKHWVALEKKFDANTKQPQTKYGKLLRSIIAIAAVSLLVFLGYTFFIEKRQQPNKIVAAAGTKSAIIPPLSGANVPYEIFRFNATTGDTIFTLNGSIIIFPGNALLNDKGEIVNGDIEVRTREFNDAFDYSIAGIPMDYDSAGKQYKFISSGMIDINAYQNGELLKVNPAAKPQLNLVSTNKERKTNLYKLDTISGKWEYRGTDEVKLVNIKASTPVAGKINLGDKIGCEDYISGSNDFIGEEPNTKPIAPQKASNINPLITVKIDPGSFKELLVYDGLKFEILNKFQTETNDVPVESKVMVNSDSVAKDASIEWDNVELKKGATDGTYIVKFSAKKKTAEYYVKPVLLGKDFEAAEKLYQEKMKEYSRIQIERKKREQDELVSLKQKNPGSKIIRVADSASLKTLEEENRKVEELNKLIIVRNKFIEAENIKIEAINKENRRRRDSAIKAYNELAESEKKELDRQKKEWEKQQAIWEQQNRTAALEQNLIRSFQIDGFGYWNCDQPTLPDLLPYTGNFRTRKNEIVVYTTLCIATQDINRIQNYYSTKTIGLMPQRSYFGWAFNANQFYYFTRNDFENAVITNNPNTITIFMNLYQGDAKNYKELKGFIFNGNNGIASSTPSYP